MSALKRFIGGLAALALAGTSVAALSAPAAQAVDPLPTWKHCYTWYSGNSAYGKCYGGTSRAYQVITKCSWMGTGINAYTRYGTIARYERSRATCAYSWDYPHDAWVKQFSN